MRAVIYGNLAIWHVTCWGMIRMRVLPTLRRLISVATTLALAVTAVPLVASTRAPLSCCKGVAEMARGCHRPVASLTCRCTDQDDSGGSSLPAERSSTKAPSTNSACAAITVEMPVCRIDHVAPSPTQGYRNRDLPTLFATFLL